MLEKTVCQARPVFMLNVIFQGETSGTEFQGKILICRKKYAIIKINALGKIFVRLIQTPEPLHNL